jgi:hypothetical protein
MGRADQVIESDSRAFVTTLEPSAPPRQAMKVSYCCRASLLADVEPIDVWVDGGARLELYRFVQQREARQQGVTNLED